jgi:chain length determinant protein EpsF
MNLQQLLLILKARWRIAAYALVITISVTVALSLLLPAQYTASTDIVLDVKSPDPIAGVAMPALAMPGYMATQVDIINSDRVAYRAIRLLHLDQNPNVIDQWREDTDGKGTVLAWLADGLQKKLDVKPSMQSNVISIKYKAPDPAFAAALANAFAQAYIDTTIDLRVEPARNYALWFEKQSKELREKLEGAKQRLSEYQQKTGVVATDERLDSENQRLNELQGQLVLAQAQSADASSKQRSGGTDQLPEVMQSGLIQQLKADIARLDSKLQEAAGNLGRNHPQYQRTEAELSTLRQRLAEETQRIVSSVGTNSQISRGKVAELRTAIDAQKKRIAQLRQGSGEAMVLQQEVESTQRALDAISQRYTQTNLESQTTQTNVSILSPAEPPIDPSFPKMVLNIALAIFLGTLLGLGAALAMEMIDRRVRSRDDLEQALNLPVLAELGAR